MSVLVNDKSLYFIISLSFKHRSSCYSKKCISKLKQSVLTFVPQLFTYINLGANKTPDHHYCILYALLKVTQMITDLSHFWFSSQYDYCFVSAIRFCVLNIFPLHSRIMRIFNTVVLTNTYIPANTMHIAKTFHSVATRYYLEKLCPFKSKTISIEGTCY